MISFSSLHLLQVLRDGRWNEQDACILVPGDIISIKLGDIVPADARLLEGDALKIDQVSKFDRERPRIRSWLAYDHEIIVTFRDYFWWVERTSNQTQNTCKYTNLNETNLNIK